MLKTTQSILEEELNKTSKNLPIFRDETVLSADYNVPKTLLHRKTQLRELVHLFNELTEVKGSLEWYQSVFLVGGNGTGKTSIAARFGIDFTNLANQKNPKVNFMYRHINCRRNQSSFLILIDLLRSIVPYFPKRGFSVEELINMLQVYLIDTNSYLILTLDEIDSLFSTEDEANRLFYNLINSYDEPFQKISLILITRNKDFVYLLEKSLKSVICKNVILFPPYTRQQITEILQNKIDNGFYEGVVHETTLDIVVDRVVDKGDIRKGMDLLWQAGKIVEAENSLIILPEHVQLNKRTSIIPKKIFKRLDLTQIIVLRSIIKLFQKDNQKLKIKYILLCNQINNDLADYNQEINFEFNVLVGILNHLKQLDLITIESDYKGKDSHKEIISISLLTELDALLPEIDQKIQNYFDTNHI